MSRSAVIRALMNGSVEPAISRVVLARTRAGDIVEIKELCRLHGAHGHELEEELSVISIPNRMRTSAARDAANDMPEFSLRGVPIELRQRADNAVGVLDAVDIRDEMGGGEKRGDFIAAAFGIDGGRAQDFTGQRILLLISKID